jgi:myo-inositol catabolism protein IolS
MIDKSVNKMWLGTELYSGSFGNKYTQNELHTIMDYCIDIGLDKIDTAECYGFDIPVEKMLGEALFNKRDKFYIATKFGHHYNNKQQIENFKLTTVKKQLENSLRNLKTDYIDIYYFHSGGNSEFDNDELWNYLNKMKTKGIIRELGLSLKHSLVTKKDNTQINKAKEYGITIVQTVLNLFSQQSLEYVVPFCKQNDIKVFGRMPLAKGLLSGKYNKDHKFDGSDLRSVDQSLVEKIISTRQSVTVKEALDWSKTFVDGIVVGSKNKEQIMENITIINQ